MKTTNEILKEHLDRNPRDVIIVSNKDGKLLIDFSEKSNLNDLIFMRTLLDLQLQKEISIYIEQNAIKTGGKKKDQLQ